MQGFFQASSLISEQPTALVPRCGACGLYKHCQSPKMEVLGSGRKSILIVGEAPGAKEDEQGQPFVGKSGSLLRSELTGLGIDFERDCWITNALICRPAGNRTPSEKEVEHCRPNLLRVIREKKPKVILLFGRSAVESLIGHLWRKRIDKMDRWVGWQIPAHKIEAWVCSTWHPAFLLRNEKERVLHLLWSRHIQAALDCVRKPLPEQTDFSDQVDCIFDPDEAASILRKMIAKGGPVCFDYETTMLKPDAEGAEIVCCGVSWRGKKTIAYPWHGAAIAATSELLKSDLPKFGANIKFEDRWTRKRLGHGVRNWQWDTMLSSHILDNRKGITSVKFQSFVRFGIAGFAYDAKVEKFLGSSGTNTLNRIREVDLSDLLLYCGADALIEYKIAEQQRKELGIHE